MSDFSYNLVVVRDKNQPIKLRIKAVYEDEIIDDFECTLEDVVAWKSGAEAAHDCGFVRLTNGDGPHYVDLSEVRAKNEELYVPNWLKK